jgi:class 3 adenylate cyclase
MNKLVMDDKGSTLICLWGLSPFSHEDDSARAILTAMNMKRALAKVDNTWCNVGISTGEVFCGVVGTSGSRKEFSVLGDYVNLAARIMYYPKKFKQTGKIFVDLQTKKDADHFIQFRYSSHCEFKGKSISLPIFEPIDPYEEAQQCLKKILPFDVYLKIHSNPFLVDRTSDIKKKQCK